MASTIKYVGPFDSITVGDEVIPRGETGEVDAEVAKELLKRDDFVRPKAAKKAPAKKAPAKKAEAKTSVAPAADETPAADAPGNPPQEG